MQARPAAARARAPMSNDSDRLARDGNAWVKEPDGDIPGSDAELEALKTKL